MATLTYDPSEQQEGELTEEEQNSLEVGEKLAEQTDQMLAGKFKNAEDLEQGYIELQKKLGSSKEEAEEEVTETKDVKEEKTEEKTEEKEIDTAFLNTLWEEGVAGEYSKETLEQLANMNSRDIAQMYLQERSNNPQPAQQELTQDNIKELKGVVGGEKEYTSMMQWAGEHLSENEVKMYDAVMEKGDPLAAFFAVQSLAYRFNDSRGVDGEMLQGKAVSEKGDTFRSQAEVVRAMSDPKYESDPAYRDDIYKKLERSKDLTF